MGHSHFFAAVALLSASPVLAHPQSTPDTQASNPDKMVCKKVPVTGSLVKGKPVCKTRRTWALESQASRRDVQEMQDHGLVNSERAQ